MTESSGAASITDTVKLVRQCIFAEEFRNGVIVIANIFIVVYSTKTFHNASKQADKERAQEEMKRLGLTKPTVLSRCLTDSSCRATLS